MKSKIVVATLSLILTVSAYAQFTGDNQTQVIDGETNNWQGYLFVGFTNSSDQVQVINGGILE